MDEISWQAPESEPMHRSAKWYLWSIAITLGCVVIALFQANLLFAIFAIIAEAVILLLGKENPRQRVFTFNEHGLYINETLLRAHADLAAFAFHDMGGRYLELVLRPSQRFHSFTRLLVPRERVKDVSAYLDTYLHEFDYHGGIADVINKHLGI